MWNYIIGNFKTLKPDHEELLFFCQENSLNNKKIKELFKIMKKSCEDISRLYNVVVQIGPFDEDAVLRVAKPLLITSYGDNTYELADNDTYFNRKTKLFYKFDGQQKLNPNYKGVIPKIMALSTREIVTNNYSSNTISLSFPI
jgi:hypothetical protein